METKSALGKRINVLSNFWSDIEPPGFICQTYSIQICCILGIHGSYLGANIRFQASIADNRYEAASPNGSWKADSCRSVVNEAVPSVMV